jgi:predicted small lipoprotein YifL
MKKYLILSLMLVMLLLVFAACGNSKGAETEEPEETAAAEVDPLKPVTASAVTDKGFVAVVHDDGYVYCGRVGQTMEEFLVDNELGYNLGTNLDMIGIKVEIIPADGKAYTDDGVDPDAAWTMTVIKGSVPSWFNKELQAKVWDAFELWKQEAFR